MSGDPFDWRADEKLREVEAARLSLAALDRAIVDLGRDLQIARSARGEFEADVRALVDQQFELRRRPAVIYRDQDGFEQFGPTPETQREYDRLAEAIKTREREYTAWVDGRRVEYRDGPLTNSWSPRNPIDVDRRVQGLRISRELAANRLAELESHLSAGELVQSGVPAPDYAEHRERVAALRARVAGGAS